MRLNNVVRVVQSFHSFLNEINVFIYQDVIVLDFLAHAVLCNFGTQKPIEARKPCLTITSCYFPLKIWHS